MRNRSAAKSAASSPPSAPWISTTTSRSSFGSFGFLLTLPRAVEGADRDLEHVVGGLARRELLRAEHGKQRDLDDRVVAVPGHEADELEARACDQWNREHAARDQPEKVRMEQGHDAEDDDADHQHDKQESSAAPWLACAGPSHLRH